MSGLTKTPLPAGAGLAAFFAPPVVVTASATGQLGGAGDGSGATYLIVVPARTES